jgi:light-regulated signal transduction histidine kinase (bacteriophytochrome)
MVSLRKALVETIVANFSLLLLAGCLFGLIRYHGQELKKEASRSKQELAMRDLRLEKLTSVLSNQARSQTYTIEANANLLLENYGGFLPRQGHEYAEQTKEASAQMEQLRRDLVGSPSSNGDSKAA